MKKYSNLSRAICAEKRSLKHSFHFKRARMLSLLCFIVICMVLFASCSGISAFSSFKAGESPADSLPQPAPYDGISYHSAVTLYYCYLDSDMLVPVETNIKMSSNERPEITILRALLSRVALEDIYSSKIPKEAKLVNMVTSGETLFVTMSREFIDSDFYSDSSDIQTAVCQIVNTLSCYGDFDVQIMIDKSGDGSGDRVSYTELGFDSSYDEKYDYAASFSFMDDMVATPSSILEFVLYRLSSSDYDILCPVFSTAPRRNGALKSELDNLHSKYEITAVTVQNEIVYQDNAKVICKIEYIYRETGREFSFFGGISLSRYQSCYKVDYEDIFELYGGED